MYRQMAGVIHIKEGAMSDSVNNTDDYVIQVGNLKHFKDKQDAANDNKYALKENAVVVEKQKNGNFTIRF